MNNRVVLPALLCVVALLAGCAGMGASEGPASPAAESAMNHVREQYAAGQYGGVIRTVAVSGDIATAPKSLRIEAYKLQAFSYCVRDFAQLCEDTFVRILQLDPGFTLAPNEAGHPQWGPVFQAAQARAGK
ncbi:hypothetical protein CAL18_18190 [Bordetella genomosp. 7]|uniref:Lipoprotein n=1 Tax=Bordetella genomosp. 7 TaxID=1416805 RepID=A0A261QWA4_9BORD|nr:MULTISPECIES: TssQ family T6SS-associated lipoprotein [Bordetella]OZI15900.1 hypothetical protein CAL18_18190 [Bordetella genomosp. 7]OZI16650.1 hypothetical protein CAL19_18425 [Bordetella genomosp. 7]